MSTTVERIRIEARSLPPEEREALLIALDYDFHRDNPQTDNDSESEAAWDQEIASRVKEIEGGGVALISAEEFERNTAELFAELGIERASRSV